MEFTRASVGGGSGPLIPRSSGFNGGIVFDCLSLRSGMYASYDVFVLLVWVHPLRGRLGIL